MEITRSAESWTGFLLQVFLIKADRTGLPNLNWIVNYDLMWFADRWAAVPARIFVRRAVITASVGSFLMAFGGWEGAFPRQGKAWHGTEGCDQWRFIWCV